MTRRTLLATLFGLAVASVAAAQTTTPPGNGGRGRGRGTPPPDGQHPNCRSNPTCTGTPPAERPRDGSGTPPAGRGPSGRGGRGQNRHDTIGHGRQPLSILGTGTAG